jgi:hypothetical protein
MFEKHGTALETCSPHTDNENYVCKHRSLKILFRTVAYLKNKDAPRDIFEVIYKVLCVLRELML